MSSRSRDLVVIGAAAAAVALGAVEAARPTPRAAEARCFTAVNRLSARPYVPVWVVMQLGSLGGALATGAAVAATGRPRLGRRLVSLSLLAWLGSKVVKSCTRRGRPATLVETARVLGGEPAGLGYPSGHAALVTAMVAAAAPHVPRRWRLPMLLGAVGVGTTRMYVGAHLPLDVAGGAALGVATERAVRLLRGPA